MIVVIYLVFVEVVECNVDDGLGREDGYDICLWFVLEYIELSFLCGKICFGSFNVFFVVVYKELCSCNGCLN